jgi:type II secretory pathway predicted ATPase ExeA
LVATTTPWVTHFGFSRTPFTKRIAARDLYLRAAHAEAVARICFCVADAALGVVCGDVGAGKTVAVRAAVATLDQRHCCIWRSAASTSSTEIRNATNRPHDRPL